MNDNRTVRKDAFDSTTSSDVSSNRGGDLENDIKRMLNASNGIITHNDYRTLLDKYKNENLVDKIIDESRKRYNKMSKEIREVAIRMAQKYSKRSTPVHEILDKMIAYKNKNNWTDAQYAKFKKEFIAIINNDTEHMINYYGYEKGLRSRINKILGSPYLSDPGVLVKDSDKGIIREIELMYQNSRNLHKSVILQSYTYEDCSLVAMTGNYDRSRHVAMNYIDPIFACLYLVKFDSIEKKTLVANFGEIVKARTEKLATGMNEGSNMLFQDIVTDPNDIVCDTENPWVDIKNRFGVQVALWETVSKLRNGQYYFEGISELNKRLESCRTNLFDNPDISIAANEGAIVSKFFSVFSLRPTWLATQTIYAINNLAIPLGMISDPGQSPLAFVNQPQTTLTRVPMMRMELPPYNPHSTATIIDKNLQDAQTQNIWLRTSEGTLVPKKQIILDSEDILVFYVNRHIQNVRVRSYINPLQFANAPITSAYFDRINKYPVGVPSRLNIQHQGEVFELRSIVIVNETEIEDTATGNKVNVSVGNCGLIIQPRNRLAGNFDPKYWLYDPYGASIPVNHPEEGYFNNKPITLIESNMFNDTETETRSFENLAKSNGTIYFYAKIKQANITQNISLF